MTGSAGANPSRRAVLGGLAAAAAAPLLGSGLRLVHSGVAAAPFLASPFTLYELDRDALPYVLTTPISLVDTEPHDSTGVRMILINGKLYDQPVDQAQYGLKLLESYRLNNDPAYLARALLQAQRLVDRHIVHGGWWYPYPFVWRIHQQFETYNPPWFSMMAQGQAMSLFVRLYRLLGDAQWKTAADQTFATYSVAPVAGQPWGVYTVGNLLWLELYPSPVAVRGDLTYNGHMWSMFGLYDYWQLTHDAGCADLLRGALTTTRDAGPLVRQPGWRSHYCVTHQVEGGKYHTYHMIENLYACAMTRDPVFARQADVFYGDYPPLSSGTVYFAPGGYTGYRFDANGRILGRKALSLTRASSAPDSDRGKVRNQPGFWYQVSAGSLAGLEVQEYAGHAYQRGRYAELAYPIDRAGTVVKAPGRAYRLSSDAVLGSHLSTLRAGTAVTVRTRAVVDAVEYLELTSGADAGFWLVASTVHLT